MNMHVFYAIAAFIGFFLVGPMFTVVVLFVASGYALREANEYSGKWWWGWWGYAAVIGAIGAVTLQSIS